MAATLDVVSLNVFVGMCSRGAPVILTEPVHLDNGTTFLSDHLAPRIRLRSTAQQAWLVDPPARGSSQQPYEIT
ncbi:hypothetical protein DMH04_33980 [Kibdelosporangium aridum]|uniref:Uncharacterized protein n=1 Tax=Kibdelosporangium aridum TaxID=2030 RepID=A0A428Z124_KIBAR|nr:hypothetical protein [Kibdelosporangium aridum]RSM78170.1 hypothetical protein DMH04_33980 [Kibdelosporangium aridum]